MSLKQSFHYFEWGSSGALIPGSDKKGLYGGASFADFKSA